MDGWMDGCAREHSLPQTKASSEKKEKRAALDQSFSVYNCLHFSSVTKEVLSSSSIQDPEALLVDLNDDSYSS